MGINRLERHPFKEAVKTLLGQFFAPSIVKNFDLIFEAEKISKLDSKHIRNQITDDKLILEVYYVERGFNVYICDLFTWMDRKQTEYKLLRYITDKFKAGQIGKDWIEKDGGISIEVTSGKFETPLDISEIVEKAKTRKGVKKN